MAENQENSPAMQSNPADTDTGSSSRKRKAEELIPVGEVNESMCRFLFEKKLTYSDVKSQNRMIIPKAYAEDYFGEFTSKQEGFSHIFMDDIGTGKVWKFCFRSWKNGISSRKYVLEGLGKYAQENTIEVGDFIMLYKDNQTDKYRISWRKNSEEAYNQPPGVKSDDLAAASSQVDCAVKNEVQAASFEVASADEYHPQFIQQDESNQFVQATDIIDAEYVSKNLNMTWDEFIDMNPFD